MPRKAARSPKVLASPTRTMRAKPRATSSRAAYSAISGPIPAGSPGVMAMTGRTAAGRLVAGSAAVNRLPLLVEADFHVGTCAQRSQPVLKGLVNLAFVDRLPRQQAQALLWNFLRLALQHLDKVDAEG